MSPNTRIIGVSVAFSALLILSIIGPFAGVTSATSHGEFTHEGTYSGSSEYVYGTAVDDNGYLYATSGQTVHKVDTSDMSQVATSGNIMPAQGRVAEFSGGYLYVGDQNGNVHKIDPSTLTVVATNSYNGNNIADLEMGDDGYLYAASWDTQLIRIHPGDMGTVGTYSGGGGSGYGVTYGDDGYIYVGNSNDEAHKVNPSTMNNAGTFGAISVVHTLAWGEGSLYVGAQYAVYRVDASTMSQQAKNDFGDQYGTRTTRDLEFHADGYVYGGMNDGDLLRFNPNDMTVESSQASAHSDPIYQLDFDSDGYLYTAGSSSTNVKKWSTGTVITSSLSGTVTDNETGSGISGVSVEVYNSTNDLVASTTTDSSGNYNFDIENGEYDIEYRNDSYQIEDRNGVSVDGDTTVNVGMDRLYIYGTVTHSDNGGALEGINVTIERNSQLYDTVETDSNGEYRVWVENGNYDISINSDTYIDQSDSVSLNDETSNYESSFSLTEKPEEYLVLVTRDFIEANETVPYRVEYIKNGNAKRVTNDATISVGNSSIIEIDRENNTLTGMDVNGTTNVTVEYQGDIELVNDEKDINVATVDLSNIGLLPFSKKIEALLWDTTVQVIFLSTFAGLSMARIMQSGGFGAGRGNDTNPWIILGISFMIVLLAGVRGYVSNGIIFSAFFYVALAFMLLQGNQKDNMTVVVNNDGNEQ